MTPESDICNILLIEYKQTSVSLHLSNGYVLKGKECGAKPDSHGWSIVPLFLDAGNLSKALPGRMKKNIFSCPELRFLAPSAGITEIKQALSNLRPLVMKLK